jgi:hypothetical protein
VDPRIRGLLEGANVAHLGTLLPDGSPHVGMKNLHGDPRVAISMVSVDYLDNLRPEPKPEVHLLAVGSRMASNPHRRSRNCATVLPRATAV